MNKYSTILIILILIMVIYINLENITEIFNISKSDSSISFLVGEWISISDEITSNNYVKNGGEFKVDKDGSISGLLYADKMVNSSPIRIDSVNIIGSINNKKGKCTFQKDGWENSGQIIFKIEKDQIIGTIILTEHSEQPSIEGIQETEIIFEQVKKSKNHESNLNTLEKKGLKIIDDQSFWIELKNWGKVKFVSTQSFVEGKSKVNFYLIDDKKNILYHFPNSYGNDVWHFEKLRAVSFKDINKDGLKDIIIITEYITGIGKEGVIPFPIGSIYFQKKNEFINLPEIDEAINKSKKNENIDMLLEFMKNKNIELDK